MNIVIRVLINLAIVIGVFFYYSQVHGMEFNIMFWKEKVVIAQELPEIIKYKENDKIPEIVIDEIIGKYATGTKAYQMKRTLFCESYYNNVQSYIVKNGERELSYGIAQIHLPSHPQVTKEQALDPEFAIKFMNDNFNKVKWYGYIAQTDKCNIIP